MHQTIRLNPETLKMSACSDFVEHIWKPGSCKNCFCLRSDHQLAPGHPQPRAGSLPPPPRLPPRPDNCRLEDEGVNSSPYSKPTIAVKPTMMSSEASDVWTEANMSADVSQVIWRRAPGKLPLPKQEDVPLVYLSSFRGLQKPAGPSTSADGHSRCPPAYAMVGLHGREARGDRSTAFHPVSFPDEKVGREDKPTFPYQELTSPQESFRQKLAAFAGMTSGCHKGPGPFASPQPLRESLPSEDDSDQRCSPSGDSEGGEYCSILDCCPGSPVAKDASQAEGSRHRDGGGDCSPTCWEQRSCAGPSEEEKRVVSFPKECCGQGPTENLPRLGPKKPSLHSEAASSSDGLSCGSASSGTSSPFAPHFESDYCSLVKEPVSGKQQDAGCHVVTLNRGLGPTGEPQPPAHPREAVQPEPIYAESTKRKKVPGLSRPQAKAEQVAAAQGKGQVRTASTWAQKTASGWGRDREGPDVAPEMADMAPQVAATITVMAAHPEEDHRTIYLSSPDSAVGVQWPRGPLSQDSEAGEEETSAGQGLSSRESHRHVASENTRKGRPAIPPKLSKSSPGGSPVSPSPSPLSDLSEGSCSGVIGPQPSSRGPTDPASSSRANGVPTSDSVRCPPPATTSSASDQRRPRFQTGAWSRQCRIEEEEELEPDLLSQRGREMENGTMDPSTSSTWHRLCTTMLAARLVCLRTLPSRVFHPAFTRASPVVKNSITKNQWLLTPSREYATRTRIGIRRGKTGQELKEAAMEPSMEKIFKIDQMGRWFVAGGAAVGLGALCYYGLGMSNELGAIEKAVIWPQYVKDRIHSTYMYLAGSIGVTALSALAVSRTPALMNFMMRGSWVTIGATFAAMIGAGMLVQSIPYDQSPGPKHLAWLLHSGVMGAVVAPLTILGGPLLIRAAWYTAGIVGGLSTVAMCAPSEKFLNMGAPLGVGLGLVFVSSLGSMFLPPTTVAGATLYSVAIYGGLVLFSMFLLYDTQKVIKRAELVPAYGVQKYDPINSMLGIYMDTLNIFMRVASILATGGNRKK